MKSPIQAKPVERGLTSAQQKNGLKQSDCCGSGKCCVGACLFGSCLGYCVPNIGQC